MSTSKPPEQLAAILASTSVLVVHGDPCVRESIIGYLRDVGFSLLDAESHQQAIRVVELGIVDAIVTDFDVPFESWRTFVSWVGVHNAKIPIYGVTGHQHIPQEEARELGSAELFYKTANGDHRMAEALKTWAIRWSAKIADLRM